MGDGGGGDNGHDVLTYRRHTESAPRKSRTKTRRRRADAESAGTSRGMESAAGLVTDEQSSPRHSSASLTTTSFFSLTSAERRLISGSRLKDGRMEERHKRRSNTLNQGWVII